MMTRRGCARKDPADRFNRLLRLVTPTIRMAVCAQICLYCKEYGDTAFQREHCCGAVLWSSLLTGQRMYFLQARSAEAPSLHDCPGMICKKHASSKSGVHQQPIPSNLVLLTPTPFVFDDRGRGVGDSASCAL